VNGPDGQTVVVDVKTWQANPGFVSRAVSQAAHYKEVTEADAASVVLANANEDLAEEGVVSLDGVVIAISRDISSHIPVPLERPSRPTAARFSRLCRFLACMTTYLLLRWLTQQRKSSDFRAG
jgi:hypothetical protein